MPWTAKDAKSHSKKADTDAKARKWAAVANSALQKCLDDGGEDCEASAVKQANGVLAKEAETMPDELDIMTAKENLKAELSEVAGSLNDLSRAISGAFYSVFDPPKPGSDSSRGYRFYCRDVYMDHPKFGDALVVSAEKDNRLWYVSYIVDQNGIAFDSTEKWREVFPTYEFVTSEEVVSENFAESAIGHALTLAEVAGTEAVVPLHLDVALITPGWGNKRDNYYYPAEVVRRDAEVFAGVKMFESDHRDHEKSTRTWVSTVTGIKGFTDDGAPIAEVSVHDENFAKRIMALDVDGLLSKMECSILAGGTAKKGFELDGRKGRQVESITQAESVDWVTRAGAGGRALALAESNLQEVEPMDEETKPDEEEMEESEQEEATFTEQEEPEESTPAPEMLASEKVHEALTKTNLPPASVLKLAESEHSDEAALQEAIKAEIAEVKARTGSGKPFGQGEGTAPPANVPLSEAEELERFNERCRKYGIREV